VLSELFILVATYLAAKKYLKFSINLKNFAKIIFSALVMGAVIYFLQPLTYSYIENWNVLLLIPIGILVYSAMLFATKTIDKNVLSLLKKGEKTPHDGQTIPN